MLTDTEWLPFPKCIRLACSSKTIDCNKGIQLETFKSLLSLTRRKKLKFDQVAQATIVHSPAVLQQLEAVSSAFRVP